MHLKLKVLKLIKTKHKNAFKGNLNIKSFKKFWKVLKILKILDNFWKFAWKF